MTDTEVKITFVSEALDSAQRSQYSMLEIYNRFKVKYPESKLSLLTSVNDKDGRITLVTKKKGEVALGIEDFTESVIQFANICGELGILIEEIRKSNCDELLEKIM